MSGGTSQYEQQARLNVLHGTPYPTITTVYLALFTTLPDAAGAGGVESADSTYARLAITCNGTNFPAATGGGPATISNAARQIMFTATGNDTNPVVGWGLFDALTSGHLVYWAPLTSQLLAAHDTPTFETGGLVVTAK